MRLGRGSRWVGPLFSASLYHTHCTRHRACCQPPSLISFSIPRGSHRGGPPSSLLYFLGRSRPRPPGLPLPPRHVKSCSPLRPPMCSAPQVQSKLIWRRGSTRDLTPDYYSIARRIHPSPPTDAPLAANPVPTCHPPPHVHALHLPPPTMATRSAAPGRLPRADSHSP